MNKIRRLINMLFGHSESQPLNLKTVGSQDNAHKTIPYQVGDIIGGVFKVHALIGAGGFGVVYRVSSSLFPEMAIALKTLHIGYLQEPEINARFEKEAYTWIKLGKHPHIVDAYQVGKDIAPKYEKYLKGINPPFITMEFIPPNEEGFTSLDDYIRRKKLDFSEIIKWAIQFCAGMEHAYLNGLRCHRDIKPSNILITQDGNVKITDFGLAALAARKETDLAAFRMNNANMGTLGQTLHGIGFGTPPYMAPEQFYEAATCDQRSDIYSFGVVLYQLATNGALPFLLPLPEPLAEDDISSLWKKMYQQHKEAPVPAVDTPLSQIILQCLEKKPSKRYQTFEQLRFELESFNGAQNCIHIPLTISSELDWSELLVKGINLEMLGHLEEALCSFKVATKANPLAPQIWEHKGSVLRKLNRLDEAISCYKKALEIDPEDPMSWEMMGRILREEVGRLEEALECYKKVSDLEPDNTQIWFEKAEICTELNRLRDGVRCYERFISIAENEGGNLYLDLAWYRKQ